MRSFELGDITLTDTRSVRIGIDMHSIEAGGFLFTRGTSHGTRGLGPIQI